MSARLSRWTDDLLSILGDQNDTEYPIFHDFGSHARGDRYDGVTVATIMWDLRKGSATLFRGNPKFHVTEHVWHP